MAFVQEPIQGSGTIGDPVRLTDDAQLVHCFQQQVQAGGQPTWFLLPYENNGEAEGAAKFFSPFDVDVLEFWCMCSTGTDTIDFASVSDKTGAQIYTGTSDGPKSTANTSYLTVSVRYTLATPIPANTPFRVEMATPMGEFNAMYTLRAIHLL